MPGWLKVVGDTQYRRETDICVDVLLSVELALIYSTQFCERVTLAQRDHQNYPNSSDNNLQKA